MAGKFEVYEDAAGMFRFRLKASNGEVLASGLGFPTRAAARQGCDLVTESARGADIVEVDS